MVLGMSLSTFTLLHVIIRLAGIGSGFIVLFGLLNGKRLDGWTKFFLTTTVPTCVTGVLFPFEGFKPSYVVGAISLVVLAIGAWERYGAPPCRSITLDLRSSDRRHGPVPQLLRRGCAVFLENTGVSRPGSHRKRAAVRGRPECGPGDLHLVDLSGSEVVHVVLVRST